MIQFDRIERGHKEILWPLFMFYNQSGVPVPGTEKEIEEEFERLCTNQVGYFARDGELVVGFVSAVVPDAFWQKNFLVERLLYVHPQYRKMGVGKQLMWLLEQWALENKLDGVRFGTSTFTGEAPEKARDFGEELGYEVIGYQLIKRF